MALRGKLEAGALKELEDKAVDDAIAMQERVGLQAIADGEMRRNNWRDRFFERVDGFSKEEIDSSFTFTGAQSSVRLCFRVPYRPFLVRRAGAQAGASGQARRRDLALNASDNNDSGGMP